MSGTRAFIAAMLITTLGVADQPTSPDSGVQLAGSAPTSSQPPELAGALEQCINGLPTTGGNCDMRPLREPVAMSRAIRITRNNVKVLMPLGRVQLAPQARFIILGTGISLEGAGKSATMLATSGDAAIDIGASDAIPRLWRLRGFTISGSAGRGSGIRMENAREGRLDDVAITDFASPDNAGIAVGNDSWTVVLDDVNVLRNAVGVAFHGSNTNAWVFRSSNISSNNVGVSFELGRNAAHGVVFSDGTHFEENKTVGIKVGSGEVYGLTVTNPYIELGPGQRFLQFKRSGDGSARLYSFSYSGGFLLLSDSPAFDLDSTGGTEDMMDGIVQALFLSRRRTDHNMAGAFMRVVGKSTRISIQGGAVAIPGGTSLNLDPSIIRSQGALVQVLQ